MGSLTKDLKNVFRRLRKKFRSVYNESFGDRNYDKYIIITYARTGSNLLMSYMDSNQEVEAKGELFRSLDGKSCRQVWDEFYAKKNKMIKAAGFKLFYNHPFNTDDREVWDFIADDPKIKIIHLVRKNKLRTFVSGEIAKKTDKWTLKSKDSFSLQDKQITIDFENFVGRVKKIYDFEEKTRKDYANRPYLEVSYEDLVDDKEKTMKSVFDFLGVSSTPVKSGYKKQNKETLAELVTNYDDFREKLAGSKYASLLDFELPDEVRSGA